MNRRKLFKTTGAAIAAATIAPKIAFSKTNKNNMAAFRYCLNTSTIRDCEPKPALKDQISIAAEAGYDGIEIWVRDVAAYLEAGNSAAELKKFIENKGIVVENAIGFAPWMVADEEKRQKGMQQLKDEMEMLASIGGKRIAAAPAGVDAPVDFLKAGKYYKQTIDLGRETGVMPQLEFWGAHKYFNHFGQILAVAAAANDSDVHLLPDVYHLFRGDSGFDCLKIVSGNAIEIFHMNDYKLEKPRLEQKDSDRVYPGDGDAPMKEILASLSQMGGTKVLSVELFNPEYWKLDAVTVAKTALEKMNNLVKSI